MKFRIDKIKKSKSLKWLKESLEPNSMKCSIYAIRRSYEKNAKWLSTYSIQELEEMKEIKDSTTSKLPQIVLLVSVLVLVFSLLFNFAFLPNQTLFNILMQKVYVSNQTNTEALKKATMEAIDIYQAGTQKIENHVFSSMQFFVFVILGLILFDDHNLRKAKTDSLVIARVIKEKCYRKR